MIDDPQLCKNNFDYTEEFLDRRFPERKEEIMVLLQDYGIGINKEDLKKLFRLDVPASSIGSAENKGTGLGLILCKEFIEKNGGSIRCESEPNRGSKFVFTVKRINKDIPKN